MQDKIKYINLSWAVVGICEGSQQSLSSIIPNGCVNEAEAVERYVIGYLSFWHIAFVDKEQLQPCSDGTLRQAACQKIDHYIQKHTPVKCLPRFYLVLLRQQIAPMEADGTSQVYQV